MYPRVPLANPWHFILCTSEKLPFCTVNSIVYHPQGNLNRPTDGLISLINQLNNFTSDAKENELKLQNCKCREIYYFQKLSKNFKRKTFSLFHMKVCLHTKNSDGFNKLCNFDILNITESHIKEDSSRPVNLQLYNHSIEQTPTEASVGEHYLIYLFLIGIHSMQGWTATTTHRVTRKRSTKRLKHTENLFRKNLQSIGVC